jgi:hypothetical protein
MVPNYTDRMELVISIENSLWFGENLGVSVVLVFRGSTLLKFKSRFFIALPFASAFLPLSPSQPLSRQCAIPIGVFFQDYRL